MSAIPCAPAAFKIKRLGVVMESHPAHGHEVEGVLNPAGIEGPDGQYYLFPRLVAAGNYSRIGVARVVRNKHGAPCGVERMGIVLEPSAGYEIAGAGMGGCEDPRVTYVPWLQRYFMLYTALGRNGAHVALASSPDLRDWMRHGLVDFAAESNTNFNAYTNKDALLFPAPVHAPDGQLSLALLHRPIYERCVDARRGIAVEMTPPPGAADHRPSIWISYCPLNELQWVMGGPARFSQHRLLARPQHEWEAYRIGGGTVPLLTDAGWLTFYHGVERYPNGGRCYRAGALVLDRHDPRVIVARTAEPIFGPETDAERVGVVGNVVFPTAVETRGTGYDVYYGMADSRIGVAQVMWDSAALRGEQEQTCVA